MAAKKKRRGLSGTPEKHESNAFENFRVADHKLMSAASDAKKGKCGIALERYSVGMAEIGSARTNAHEASPFTSSPYNQESARVLGRLVTQVEEAAQFAYDAIKQNCLKNTSGLSGMKRRSRR